MQVGMPGNSKREFPSAGDIDADLTHIARADYVDDVWFEFVQFLRDAGMMPPERRIVPEALIEVESERASGNFQMGDGILSAQPRLLRAPNTEKWVAALLSKVDQLPACQRYSVNLLERIGKKRNPGDGNHSREHTGNFPVRSWHFREESMTEEISA
jgi:hypothetical protein